MTYAPHTNTDVRHAILCGNPQPLPLLLGEFRERESDNVFEYAVRPDDGVDFAPNCPHIVYVTKAVDGIDQGYRYAKVHGRFAWIAVDESEFGTPVYEKWDIKGHHKYDTDWVKA